MWEALERPPNVFGRTIPNLLRDVGSCLKTAEVSLRTHTPGLDEPDRISAMQLIVYHPAYHRGMDITSIFRLLLTLDASISALEPAAVAREGLAASPDVDY